MLSRAVLAAFRDELEKLSAVSTAGLSPRAALETPQPEPFETAALTRAREILGRAEMMKTAAAEAAVAADPPAKKEEATDRYSKLKRYAGSGLAGGAAGNMVSRLSLKRGGMLSPLRQTVGTVGGAAVGAGLAAAEPHLRRWINKEKTAVALGMGFKPGRAGMAVRRTGTRLMTPGHHHIKPPRPPGVFGKAGRL